MTPSPPDSSDNDEAPDPLPSLDPTDFGPEDVLGNRPTTAENGPSDDPDPGDPDNMPDSEIETAD